MSSLCIRRSRPEDLPHILAVYANGRQIMRDSGNVHQWKNNYPPREIVENDIRAGISYVVMQGEEVCGVFVFFLGEDPTYRVIEDGCWLNQMPYGVIHRVASAGSAKGIAGAIFSYCGTYCDNLRIDTHEDNTIMQHVLKKHSFVHCGRIYLEDGSPRMAFHRCQERVFKGPKDTFLIRPAQDLGADIRPLFDEYMEMLVEGDPVFREYLAVQQYDDEIADLHLKYSLPFGRLYIAYANGVPAGCIGLKKLDDSRCEIKRLYVRPAYRNQGLARKLTELVLYDAGRIGYRYVLLDTLPFLTEAISLYMSMGFYEIDKYVADSPMKHALYLQKDV